MVWVGIVGGIVVYSRNDKFYVENRMILVIILEFKIIK